MGVVNEIADHYVDEWAALDPTGATSAGIAGHDDRLTDLSPEGYAALADLDRRTLAQLRLVSPADEREQVALEAMRERLGLELELYDAGMATSEVSVLSGAMHNMRATFDLMPIKGEAAAEAIAARLAQVPTALTQVQRTLLEAAEHGHASSQYQIVEHAKQCEAWVGQDDLWPELARRVIAAGQLPENLTAALVGHAGTARDATASFARYLREELLPHGRVDQAAGAEHYSLKSRRFLGAKIDLAETYAWGFEELARIEAQMRKVAGQIVPGGTVADAAAALDADPARLIHGKEAYRDWMQQLADEAISSLHGKHFDIPEQVRRIECCIAPTSDGGVYYTGPSEDFTRPGRMWWAVPAGMESFSTWKEVTTVYHEGVPGHHLQIGQTAARAELLNRWQRFLCWVSGHGEGWALYSERLMDELGYLDDPANKLGMLDAQALRAARVIVDIGFHMGLTIPTDNPFGFHPGERWTPELVWEFMRAHCTVNDALLRFEVNRYLGWPGQAPSYKVGERIWLQARDDAKARMGAAFDLKAFHRAALDLGPIGLDPLRAALARI